MTMGNSWSYVPNDVYKPTNELIEKLVDIVSKGGNYLLNIGPGPDGTFDDTAYARLRDIGKWMKVNGEAIYGTRMYDVYGEGNNIRYTSSKDKKTTYVFFFNEPSGKIVLEKLRLNKGASVQLLGSKAKVTAKPVGEGTEISFPSAASGGAGHVWVVRVGN